MSLATRQAVPQPRYNIDLNAETGVTAHPDTNAGYDFDLGTGLGVKLPVKWGGGYVHVLARIATTGGVASMTLALYGKFATDGRWYHLADLASGSGITAAAFPNAYYSATDGRWAEPVQVLSGFTHVTVRVLGVGGTDAAITTYIGVQE
jgi:hypothetical protein